MNTLHKQVGFSIIETMIGLLLFSIGILGMINMLAISMKVSSDASFRSEASYLSDQIIAQMWADRSNLASYELNAGSKPCGVGANASANLNVQNWLADVAHIPGTGNVIQQILLDPATNQVTVTLCWQAKANQPMHNYTSISSIN